MGQRGSSTDSDVTNHSCFPTDPQTWKEWTRARNAYEYLITTEALCAGMSQMSFPFVCFHGDIDTMTDPEGSKRLHEQSQVRLLLISMDDQKLT